jgi:hypothetical protein
MISFRPPRRCSRIGVHPSRNDAACIILQIDLLDVPGNLTATRQSGGWRRSMEYHGVTSWPDIPEDVIEWFRRLYSQANRRVSETLLNVPSIRETSLDDDLIQSLIPRSAPTRLGSGAVVRLDVHNIGGLRRVSRWEIGDIGILVFVVHRGKIIGRKVAVLQAKRLYPS